MRRSPKTKTTSRWRASAPLMVTGAVAACLAIGSSAAAGASAGAPITDREAFEFFASTDQLKPDVAAWIATTCGGAEGSLSPDQCRRSLSWNLRRVQLIAGGPKELVATFSTGGGTVGSSGIYVIGRQANGRLRVLMHYEGQVVGYTPSPHARRLSVSFNDAVCGSAPAGSQHPFATFVGRGSRLVKVADTTTGCAPASGLRPVVGGGYRGPGD